MTLPRYDPDELTRAVRRAVAAALVERPDLADMEAAFVGLALKRLEIVNRYRDNARAETEVFDLFAGKLFGRLRPAGSALADQIDGPKDGLEPLDELAARVAASTISEFEHLRNGIQRRGAGESSSSSRSHIFDPFGLDTDAIDAIRRRLMVRFVAGVVLVSVVVVASVWLGWSTPWAYATIPVAALMLFWFAGLQFRRAVAGFD